MPDIVTTQFQNVLPSQKFYIYGGDGKLHMKIADGIHVQIDGSPGTTPAYNASEPNTTLCVVAPCSISLT